MRRLIILFSLVVGMIVVMIKIATDSYSRPMESETDSLSLMPREDSATRSQ